MFGLFRQMFMDSRFFGSCSRISLQLIFKILGIASPFFHHPYNLGYKRMIVEDGFGMLPLQLSLLIKGAVSMFIIDGTDVFCCCPLCILDRIPETCHFLEDRGRIFNVMGLPEVLFFLMALTIYDVTVLSERTVLAVSRSIAKTFASTALTKAMLEAQRRSICSDFSIIIY